MVKKTIAWVTPDYFLDTDLNPDLLKIILRYFNIHWIILFPKNNIRFSERDFDEIKKESGIEIEFIYCSYRNRDPRMLFFYSRLYRRIKQIVPDLVYFNYVPTDPYILPLFWRFTKRKTIFTAHDGNVKPEFAMPWVSKIVFKLAFSTALYVNLFSYSQESVFKSVYIGAKTFVIPLGLKNFGTSNLSKRHDNIIFLFFGSINSNKNLQLLINAACNLYEKGVRGFKISINGSCINWKFYQSLIRYSNLFECDIRALQNSEIPDLFVQNHYMVLPYKNISQSGVLKIAFNYCMPVIVSDLKGFTDEVRNGVNGFIFRSCDVNDLEKVMLERLQNHNIQYTSLQENISKFNTPHYSTDSLANKYLDMFNEVLVAK